MKLWERIFLSVIIGCTLTALTVTIFSYDNITATIIFLILYVGAGYIYQPHLSKLLRFGGK